MKRKQWQCRLLSCFLAVAVLLGGLLCCLPVRAGAIVPLGLVQSALASYVTSTGYKMYNDQGTGQDILGSLSDLYQTWLDSSAGQVLSLWTLTHIASIEAVYADQSGNIIITKQAADVFQQFADWVQTEYSVPVGSATPTQVLSGSGNSASNSDGTVNASLFNCTVPVTVGSYTYYRSSEPLGIVSQGPLYCATSASGIVVAGTFYNNNNYFSVRSGPVLIHFLYSANDNFYDLGATNFTTTFSRYNVSNLRLGSVSSSNPANFSYSDLTISNVASNLAVTLAQAVADVAGRIEEDDESLVVGVGASAGATAEEIADLVAQGIKAQTLEPAVTVVVDAVIDTPVQPYPDIDNLGLPTLGAALVSRFPFCVPWDFVDTLRILNAAPIPPVFDVTLVPASVAARWGVSGNYTLHVDLTSPEYAKLFVALRWGTLVGFCLGLALLTKRLIWTA